MRPIAWLLFLFLSIAAVAGSFEEFTWRTSFQSGGGYYQPTLKITYTYAAEGEDLPEVRAIPRDANLVLMDMRLTVDGQKAEAQQDYATTWWSGGEEVPVYLPPTGQKIEVEAFYIIKNLFLIPPAPTNLAVPVKSLEVGFASLAKFNFSGNFVGPAQKFKDRHIVAKEGDPTTMKYFSVKDVPANNGEQGLFFLVPKSFNFSFNLLRGSDKTSETVSQGAGQGNAAAVLGGIGTQAGTPGAGDADAAQGDLKVYSMVFYAQNPDRDWKYAPTWMQQEYTYLPHGIVPGGRVKSRTLFNGAGDKADDLIAWVGKPPAGASDATSASKDPAPYQAIDLFVKDWRASVKIDTEQSRLVTTEGDGMISPAMANKRLAEEINHRFGLKTVPALSTRISAKTAPSMPLSAFHGMLTALQIQGKWFVLDAADNSWDLRSWTQHLKGKNVVILDDKVQMATF